MADAIDLAVEPPFALGPLRVVPPLRTVEHTDGAREVLEPRVMQVLVALHGAGGAIVSRHELAERCWAGRIVGEDALNRVLSRLRRVTEGIGKDAFRIETVTKVGYRLVVPGEPAPDCRPLAAGPGIETAPLRAGRRLPPGKWLAGAGFALATAAAVSGFSLWQGGRQDSSDGVVVAVERFVAAPRDDAAGLLSGGLAADLARVALDLSSELQVVDANDGTTGDADLRLTGTVESAGGRVHATARVIGQPDDRILWSKSFAGDTREIGRLREEIATQTASVLSCASDAIDELELPALRLFLLGCEQMNDNIPTAMRTLGRVTELAPGYVRASVLHAGLQATVGSSTPGEPGRAMREEAAATARAVLATHPNEYRAYQVLANALPAMADWFERGRMIDLAMRAPEPNASVVSGFGYQYTLVGLLAAGTPYLERGQQLSPFGTSFAANLAEAYAYGGRLPDALRLLGAMEKRYPQSLNIVATQLEIHTRVGDPQFALGLLGHEALQAYFSPDQLALWRAVIEARADPSRKPAAVARMVSAADSASDVDTLTELLQHLVLLGAVDEAYAIAGRLGELPRIRQDIWWRSFMAPFRADARFPALIERQGTPAIWRQLGKLPDYCAGERLSYDCRTTFLRQR